jgi:EAL domain-containing protein (putative c-di-GMP-specific phosphodiesterase class I)
MAIAAPILSPASPPERALLKGERLKDERNRFVAFAFAAADLLIEVNADLRISFAIGAAEGLTGRGLATLIGTDFLDLFGAADRAVIRAAVGRMQDKSRIGPIALRLVKADHQEIVVALSGCRLDFLQGVIHFAISTLRLSVATASANLLDKDAFEAATLDWLSRRDGLAGSAVLNLLKLDGVEDFRSGAGDGALDALFNEIGGFLRAYAVGGLAGRIGPDRLAAVTDGTTPVDFTKEIMDILQLHDPEGSCLHVQGLSVALDVAELSPNDAGKALSYTLQEFASSDIAKLPFRSLIDSLRDLMAKTAKRVIAFKQSLIGHGMRLVFQPVVELAVRRIQHYEVLTRFADNKSPFDTIAFAERVGLIEELDLTVAERALNFLDNAGPGCTASLAVNISGRSIQNDAFVAALEKLLARYAVVRPRILFEITESTNITNLTQVAQVIQCLRGAGNRICLDDFGAGAASLPYLHAFHVDFIKIDGAYVRRMQDSERDQQILNAMVSMCQQVKTRIVAEMIETQQQALALLAIGVELGQGYYFGKPADKLASLAPLRGGARL